MSNAESILIKQQRRMLLNNLNLFYPTPVELRTLWRTVCEDETYEKALYKKDIAYFKQKGYIEFRGGPLASDDFDKKVVLLTARGKEIAEKTMTDPALEI